MTRYDDQPRVQLAHGGGGRSTHRLVEELLLPAFDNAALGARHDGARVELAGTCAFTTDSYVVQPLEFPGGDIGALAVNGTVNDLAMCGARPACVSLGLILEEGLPMEQLRRIVGSIAHAARGAGVQVVTGDTKVVERGKADAMFINTSGIGRVIAPAPVLPAEVRAGDAVILSGDIGRHGLAVLSARNDLGFEPAIISDCAPLVEPVLALFAAGIGVRCLRDLTRGGLASALVEIAEASGNGMLVDETRIAISTPVAMACEILGLDALYVANEGRFIAIVHPADAERALSVLSQFTVSAGATVIGRVEPLGAGQVALRTKLGTVRALDMLSGEQLPRIC